MWNENGKLTEEELGVLGLTQNSLFKLKVDPGRKVTSVPVVGADGVDVVELKGDVMRLESLEPLALESFINPGPFAVSKYSLFRHYVFSNDTGKTWSPIDADKLKEAAAVV